MCIFGKLLSLTRGQGLILLLVALGLGITSDSLGELGRGVLPIAAFLVILGAFLTAGLSPCETKAGHLLLAVVLAWVGIGLPLVEAGHLLAVRPDFKVRVGLLLSLLVPPVGGAVVIGAMLSRIGLEPVDSDGRIKVRRSITLAWAVASLSPSPIAAGHLVACAVPALAMLLVATLGGAVYGLGLRLVQWTLGVVRRRPSNDTPASAEELPPSSPNSRGIRETG